MFCFPGLVFVHRSSVSSSISFTKQKVSKSLSSARCLYWVFSYNALLCTSDRSVRNAALFCGSEGDLVGRFLSKQLYIRLRTIYLQRPFERSTNLPTRALCAHETVEYTSIEAFIK